jgi:tRNA 2-thiouridine synthesizing protein A
MAATKAADTTHFDRELDVRGLTCPLPALRTRAALSRMRSGQVLRVVSTDRDSPRDFRRFAENTGHRLLGESAGQREFVFYFRKA